MTELADSAWKTRLAAVQSLKEKVESKGDDIEAEAVIRALMMKPGMKESNFQVMASMFQIFASLATLSTFSPACVALAAAGMPLRADSPLDPSFRCKRKIRRCQGQESREWCDGYVLWRKLARIRSFSILRRIVQTESSQTPRRFSSMDPSSAPRFWYFWREDQRTRWVYQDLSWKYESDRQNECSYRPRHAENVCWSWYQDACPRCESSVGEHHWCRVWQSLVKDCSYPVPPSKSNF